MVGLDWLTMTGTGEPSEVLLLLETYLGPWDVQAQPRRHFTDRVSWPSGAEVNLGHRDIAWAVNVPGAACVTLGGRVWDLGRDLRNLGGKCTRLDIRRDLRGEGLRWITEAEASCKRGELCRVRQWSPYPTFSNDGELLGHGLYLGSRSSEQFIRFYDKGLERVTDRPGAWLRFEAQLRKERAERAAAVVWGASADTWANAAASVLYGVAEFREVTGDPNLDRRPLAAWWREFTGNVSAIRPDLDRRYGNLETRVAWLSRSVHPDLQAIADQLGGDWTAGKVLDALCGRGRYSEAHLKNLCVVEAVEFLRQSDPSFP